MLAPSYRVAPIRVTSAAWMQNTLVVCLLGLRSFSERHGRTRGPGDLVWGWRVVHG